MNLSDQPTPETDEESRWGMDVHPTSEVVNADFARSLEQRLGYAHAALREILHVATDKHEAKAVALLALLNLDDPQ